MRNKIFFTVFFAVIILAASISSAQDVEEKIRDKTNDRIDNKIDEGVDKGLDKVEDGIMGLFKKKENKPEADENQQEDRKEAASQSTEDNKGLKTYSKFDFIPGEKIIFYDDFSQDAVGDFPALWNTNGSGEVVTTSKYPEKWFMPKGGELCFAPDVSVPFTENFTLEFNMIFTENETANENFRVTFIKSAPGWKAGEYADNEADVNLSRTSVYASSFINGDNYFSSAEKNYDLISTAGKPVRVSIWVQNQRLRLYINETKLLDLPRLIPKKMEFDKLQFTSGSEDQNTLINDVRVAVGLPDTRSKLLTEGKLITHGITFDSGSDKIKPQSFGVLKEIADVLKENPSLKIKIVGHTDSDGDDAFNMKLSQRRAVAVKNSLMQDFGIDSSRMQTDGKGENQPISPNDSPDGKANNRRVEFIKL